MFEGIHQELGPDDQDAVRREMAEKVGLNPDDPEVTFDVIWKEAHQNPEVDMDFMFGEDVKGRLREEFHLGPHAGWGEIQEAQRRFVSLPPLSAEDQARRIREGLQNQGNISRAMRLQQAEELGLLADGRDPDDISWREIAEARDKIWSGKKEEKDGEKK